MTCRADIAVTWLAHMRQTPGLGRKPATPAAADSCAARLAAMGLGVGGRDAGNISSSGGGGEVRLVPAAATARVTAATLSRRILYDSMAKQLDSAPLQVGGHLPAYWFFCTCRRALLCCARAHVILSACLTFVQLGTRLW